MNVFDLSSPVPLSARNAVVVIGNFDAVHLGHQALLAEALKIAQANKQPLAVLTFEPHPRRLFRPDDPPFRITPLPLKLERMEFAGVDLVYVCPFDWNLAGLSADDFVQSVLKDKLSPAHIVIGHDFHFGQHRTGNPDTLRRAGFPVTHMNLVADAGHAVISATRIRGLIQSGHMDEAKNLLGWDWEIRGKVEHGNKRGRDIGYPTANMALGETLHPAYGVYAAWVKIGGEDVWRPSATNIGIRPMFAAETGLIESYIFDFAREIYGESLRVRPVCKIRDELKFDNLDDLIGQIDADCRQIRGILDSTPVCR